MLLPVIIAQLRRHKRMVKTVMALAFLLCTSACSTLFPGVYKIDIEQGNQLKDGDVEQLRIGMSKAEVESP